MEGIPLRARHALAASGAVAAALALCFAGAAHAATKTAKAVNYVPKVAISTPANGATVTGIVAWKATATDANGVAKVDFRIDGTPLWTDKTSPYAFTTTGTWDTGKWAVGAHNLTVIATDKTGKKATVTHKVTVTRAPTSTPDTQAPTVPSGVAAGAVTATSVTVTWNASSDNVGVAGYGLSRNGAGQGSTTGTSYTFSGLACGTTYTFGVDAYDAAGNRSAVSPTSATTAPCTDAQAPSAPSGLTSTSTTANAIVVSWGASSDNVGVTGYGLSRNGAGQGSTTGTSYTFSGLACGTSYTLAVDAFDAAGNRSAASSISRTTSACSDAQAPSVPSGLAATSATQTSVNVTWTASTDNVAVTGYGVLRGGVSQGSTTATSYTFGGLTCGTSYTFGVNAADAAGNRSATASISATTAGCSPVPPPPPPPTGTAQVFIATNGSDANPCTQAAPCLGFDRAYKVAQPGQTVEVAAGTYSGQVLNAATKASRDDIVFRPAAGATVSLSGSINTYAKDVEFRGFNTKGWYIRGNADDVTMRNIRATGGTFVVGAEDVSIIGGEIYNADSVDGMQVKPDAAGRQVRNLLIDGVYVHDLTRVSDPTVHVDCMQIMSGIGVVVRNVRAEYCSTQGVFFKEDLGGTIDQVLVENSVFGLCPGTCYYMLIFDKGVTNATARYNSFAKSPDFWRSADQANIQAYGNAGIVTACDPQVAYHHNVWSSAKCGTTDVQADPGFLNPDTLDLRLRVGSPAVDRGDSTLFPGADIDGRLRPFGGAPDAGAYEM